MSYSHFSTLHSVKLRVTLISNISFNLLKILSARQKRRNKFKLKLVFRILISGYLFKSATLFSEYQNLWVQQ
jgi:hypothetical protein